MSGSKKFHKLISRRDFKRVTYLFDSCRSVAVGKFNPYYTDLSCCHLSSNVRTKCGKSSSMKKGGCLLPLSCQAGSGRSLIDHEGIFCEAARMFVYSPSP